MHRGKICVMGMLLGFGNYTLMCGVIGVFLPSEGVRYILFL